MTQHYMSGDYAITGVQNAFNNKISYWISKRDCTDAYYCFSLENNGLLNIQLQEQLANFAAYIALYEAKHAAAKTEVKRDFEVQTPLGTLRAWSKHETDTMEDYPGVYVDLKGIAGNNQELLACVEYDSGNNRLQTCVYQPEQDEPVEIIVHELPESEATDENP